MIVFGPLWFVVIVIVLHHLAQASSQPKPPVQTIEKPWETENKKANESIFYGFVLVVIVGAIVFFIGASIAKKVERVRAEERIQKTNQEYYRSQTNAFGSDRYSTDSSQPVVEKSEKPKSLTLHPLPPSKQEFYFKTGRITMTDPKTNNKVIIVGHENACNVNGVNIQNSFNNVVRNYLSIGWEGVYFPY